MREAHFEALVDSFVQLDQQRDELQTDRARAVRPGAWLLDSLGLSLTCVGLDYEDGVWARRYLSRVDTRSAEEMLTWDRRTARAWLRRNLASIPREAQPGVTQKLEPGQSLDDAAWRQTVERVDWGAVGPWGPGIPVRSGRLRRVQGLFILTRIVSDEVSPHAAFSFMIGSSRSLAGHSPLMFVGAFGHRRFEETLLAADNYMAAQS